MEAPTDFPIVDDPSAQYENLYGEETMQRALCIDFDGVLHSYVSGWQGHTVIPDDPIPGAVQSCHALIEAGWKLYVLSSRSELRPVAAWLAEHCFPPMTLTRVKPIAVAYIDDRGIRFTNWSDIRRMFA